MILAARGQCDTGDAAREVALRRRCCLHKVTTSIPASHVSCMHVGAVAWVVAGSEWGCWLSLLTGLHSTDSGRGGTRGPIHERSQTAVALATSQTVCDRHRTCYTTYSRNASQNLRPVARAIVYATSYIHSSTLLRPTSK